MFVYLCYRWSVSQARCYQNFRNFCELFYSHCPQIPCTLENVQNIKIAGPASLMQSHTVETCCNTRNQSLSHKIYCQSRIPFISYSYADCRAAELDVSSRHGTGYILNCITALAEVWYCTKYVDNIPLPESMMLQIKAMSICETVLSLIQQMWWVGTPLINIRYVILWCRQYQTTGNNLNQCWPKVM